MSTPASGEPAAGGRFATAFLALVVALAVFHHLPAVLPGRSADWFDLLTPFVVVGATAATLLPLRPPPWLAVAAMLAAVAYVDGHGIHLAANSIGHVADGTSAEERAHFWDETFGHVEWHAGLLGLLGAIAASGSARLAVRRPRLLVATSAVLLGFTLFTGGVEGGTWPLFLAAGVVLVAYAVRTRTVPAVAVGCALATAALLMAVWAIWQGGMPQFSEVGFI